MEPLDSPGKKPSANEKLAAKTEAQPIGQAIRSISGPLIRQIRKFQLLELCRAALSPQLMAHCAPFDVKMLQGESEEPVYCVFWYTSSQTAQTALESRKREMLRRINESSPQLVEDFRYESAGPERISEQLNILSAGPD